LSNYHIRKRNYKITRRAVPH